MQPSYLEMLLVYVSVATDGEAAVVVVGSSRVSAAVMHSGVCDGRGGNAALVSLLLTSPIILLVPSAVD